MPKETRCNGDLPQILEIQHGLKVTRPRWWKPSRAFDERIRTRMELNIRSGERRKYEVPGKAYEEVKGWNKSDDGHQDAIISEGVKSRSPNPRLGRPLNIKRKRYSRTH